MLKLKIPKKLFSFAPRNKLIQVKSGIHEQIVGCLQCATFGFISKEAQLECPEHSYMPSGLFRLYHAAVLFYTRHVEIRH